MAKFSSVRRAVSKPWRDQRRKTLLSQVARSVQASRTNDQDTLQSDTQIQNDLSTFDDQQLRDIHRYAQSDPQTDDSDCLILKDVKHLLRLLAIYRRFSDTELVQERLVQLPTCADQQSTSAHNGPRCCNPYHYAMLLNHELDHNQHECGQTSPKYEVSQSAEHSTVSCDVGGDTGFSSTSREPAIFCNTHNYGYETVNLKSSESDQPRNAPLARSGNAPNTDRTSPWCRIFHWHKSKRVGDPIAARQPQLRVQYSTPNGTGKCNHHAQPSKLNNPSKARTKQSAPQSTRVNDQTLKVINLSELCQNPVRTNPSTGRDHVCGGHASDLEAAKKLESRMDQGFLLYTTEDQTKCERVCWIYNRGHQPLFVQCNYVDVLVRAASQTHTTNNTHVDTHHDTVPENVYRVASGYCMRLYSSDWSVLYRDTVEGCSNRVPPPRACVSLGKGWLTQHGFSRPTIFCCPSWFELFFSP